MMIFSIHLSAQEPIDLFIIAGQSNAQGFTTNGINYPADVNNLDPLIRLNWTAVSGYPWPITNHQSSSSAGWTTMGNQQHYPGHEPPQTGVLDHFGPEVRFSRYLKEAGYNPAIFKFVFPGSGMDLWIGTDPGFNNYDRLKTELALAIADLESQGKTVNVRGFLWIQGESDSHNANLSNSFNDYMFNLNFIINDIRNELQQPKLPIVLSANEIYSNIPNDMPRITAIQRFIAANDPRIVYSTTAGLTGSGNHFDESGVDVQGVRLFDDFSSIVQTPSQNSNWEVVWNDEFNGSVLDLTKWKYGVTDGRWEEWFNSNNVSIENISAGNNELVLGTNDQNHTTAGGVLKKFGGSEISTKMPPTDLSANFKYGYYEARIKVAYNSATQNGRGYFPAFWLSVKNGGNATWPPELDVFEYSGVGDYIAGGSNQLIQCSEANNGSLPDRHYSKSLPSAHSSYHVYGMEWDEFEIKWYLDNVQIGTTAIEEVPHDFFRIVLSNQLAYIPDGINPLGDLNDDKSSVHVDWVRLYKPIGAPLEYDYDKWNRIWHSADREELGTWDLTEGDKHIKGDFNNDGLDEVLSISASTTISKLHQFESGVDEWNREWGNSLSGTIGPWHIKTTDLFFSGNFDGSGDKLLCIGDLNSALLKFDGSIWTTAWGNGGLSWLGGWPTNTGDRFFICDFNNNGRDDILCISADALFYKIIEFNGQGWTTIFGNSSGTGKIVYNTPVPKGMSSPSNSWSMKSTDSFIVGDFSGNSYGEILIIDEVDGNSLLLEFTADNELEFKWNNSGEYTLGSWNTEEGSSYYAYNMDSDSKTELFCISPDHKHEKILSFAGSWYTQWENFGSYQIYNRDLSNGDAFIFGNFVSEETTNVLWIKPSWSFPSSEVFGNPVTQNCGSTVYLHEMPQFGALLLPGENSNESTIDGAENEIIKLYPNPNEGHFIIDMGTAEDVRLSIHNAMGQEVYFHSKASGRLEVDLSNRPSGIYIVKIDLGNEFITKKLIKK